MRMSESQSETRWCGVRVWVKMGMRLVSHRCVQGVCVKLCGGNEQGGEAKRVSEGVSKVGE